MEGEGEGANVDGRNMSHLAWGHKVKTMTSQIADESMNGDGLGELAMHTCIL